MVDCSLCKAKTFWARHFFFAQLSCFWQKTTISNLNFVIPQRISLIVPSKQGRLCYICLLCTLSPLLPLLTAMFIRYATFEDSEFQCIESHPAGSSSGVGAKKAFTGIWVWNIQWTLKTIVPWFQMFYGHMS